MNGCDVYQLIWYITDEMNEKIEEGNEEGIDVDINDLIDWEHPDEVLKH